MVFARGVKLRYGVASGLAEPDLARFSWDLGRGPVGALGDQLLDKAVVHLLGPTLRARARVNRSGEPTSADPAPQGHATNAQPITDHGLGQEAATHAGRSAHSQLACGEPE